MTSAVPLPPARTNRAGFTPRFVQRTQALWRPELRRRGKVEAAGTGANTAATPPEHWSPSRGLLAAGTSDAKAQPPSGYDV
jgi:hypothetical protein